MTEEENSTPKDGIDGSDGETAGGSDETHRAFSGKRASAAETSAQERIRHG